VAGYFKLYRDIFESSIWMQPVDLRLFIYLIGQARYKEEPNTKYKTYGINIKRGQFLRSYRKIRDDLEYFENNALKHYSLSVIKRSVDRLVEQERIEIEQTKLGTLFTVVNYCQYQDYQEKCDQLGTDLEQGWNGAGTDAEQYSKKGKEGEKREKEKRSDSESPNPPSKTEGDNLKFGEESRPYKAAMHLRKRILENNEKAQVPQPDPKSMEKWAYELDKLNRLGPVGRNDAGYDWKEIGMIMEWCQDHHFWNTNILSAGTFREQIIKLENQMKSDINNGEWKASKNSKQKGNKRKELFLKYKNEEKNNSGGE